MAWLYDEPSGVFKDHALSRDTRKAAVADAQVMRWLRPIDGFGMRSGQSVTITRSFPLPLASRVTETDRLPSGRAAIDTKTVTVSEWGFKIELTGKERDLSSVNLSDIHREALRDQMRLTMDSMAAEALKSTPVKYIPTAAGGVFDTDGTPSTTADVNLTVADLRAIHDYLAGDLKAPGFRNGRYIGVLSTKAARGIKNDPEFKDWFAPSTSEPFVSGRIRAVENFDLYETNHYDALSNTKGSGSVLGEALFFGADPGFLAVVQQPELRMGLPGANDLGRFVDIGWVGTIEAGLTWDIASRARVIHVTSQ